MAHALDFTKAAVRDLKRLPKDVHTDIASAIEALAGDPRPQGCEKLEGSTNVYRVRCGDYRLIYQILDDIRTVRIARARHRREVYRHMSDLLKQLR
jgi:mRNA interferase RelE/StbE